MKTSSIRIEGNILSPELFDKLDSTDILGQNPVDFGFDRSFKVKDDIARAWADAKDQWNIFKRRIDKLSENATGVEETRKFWIIPLLENLGYTVVYQKSAETVNDKTYALSHRSENLDGLPINVMGINDNLDKRREAGGPRMSPHALLQEYLNVTEHLFGLVTNGYFLRVLRDSGKLVRLSYLEFNLQRMLEDDLYAEFSIMYRLVHASRMPRKQTETEQSIIEQYHQDAIESGSRIREKLSVAVEESIKTVANGFMSHPANEELRTMVIDGTLKPEAYFQHLLRFIYRILFLLVIEERDIVYPDSKSENHIAPENYKRFKEIYFSHYSISRLRKLAEKIYFFDDKLDDLWSALKSTFALFEQERFAKKLGIYPLGGDLFSFGAIGKLADAQLSNRVLLECIRNLSLFENPNGKNTIRVNYAALNVEEFGSVYEGLLEYDGKFTVNDNQVVFEFVQSSARSSSGSHYTPEELVQPLIKHSLDYIIEDKLEIAKRVANSEWRAGMKGIENSELQAGEERMANSELRADKVRIPLSTSNSPLTITDISIINEVITNEFISRFGSLETGDGNRRIGLQADKTISKGRTLRNDFSDPKSSNLDSGKYSGGLGQTENKGIHAIYKDSERESEGIGNTRDVSSKSGSGYSGSGGEDSERMSNSKQTASEFTKKSISEVEISNWWNRLPQSTRYSLLASNLLLSIRVCDVACGSGHILLSAARRIAIDLARVRTGEEQPSPGPYRQALRDVINHCIYGVDKNPLAVELCKVALWLEAYNPGMPLSFLDHRIKCGDSIVGLARQEELQNGIAEEAFKKMPGDDAVIVKELLKKHRNEVKGTPDIFQSKEISQRLDEISVDFAHIDDLPEHTLEEVKIKAEKYNALKGADWWNLKEVADLQVAQFFIPKTHTNFDKIATYSDYVNAFTKEKAHVRNKIAKAVAVSSEKKFFHWFLEFPEVMQKGGFDCILGNPPYLGGSKISANYGDNYLSWIHSYYVNIRDKADFVCSFMQRNYSLILNTGFNSVITTNTIAQGDTREGSLQVIVHSKGKIIFAIKNLLWPGLAAVKIDLVVITKKHWKKHCLIDKKQVSNINSFLEDEDEKVDPYRLLKPNKIFYGSKVQGDGFLLDKAHASSLINSNKNNKKVLSPYLNGYELNNSVILDPQTWIINFQDIELAKCQDDYPECFAIVRDKVKIERQTYLTNKMESGLSINSRDERLSQFWWQLEGPRKELYDNIRMNHKALVHTRVTKTHAFVVCNDEFLFSDALIVITFDKYSTFSYLQNTIHESWAWYYSSTLKGDRRYSPNDCYETFPFPQNTPAHLEQILETVGEQYHTFRSQLMLKLNMGLTKTYNLFHTPKLKVDNPILQKAKMLIATEQILQDIRTLRALHKQMDEAVLKAYGWEDINLAHDFYEVDYLPENDRVRYTISPEARKEVLNRLLELNHKIHAEEVAAGLWDKKKSAGKKKTAAVEPPPPPDGYVQEGLF